MNTNIESLIAKYEEIRKEQQEEVDFYSAVKFTKGVAKWQSRVADTDLILAALRQADQHAQPVAWRINYPSGPEYTNNEPGFLSVSYTPLFTSPPAPQAREFSDEEISAIAEESNYPIGVVRNVLQSIKYIAADRAIRPAAGIVSDDELCIVKLIHHYGPYADFLMSDGTTRKLDSIDIGKYKWVYNESAAAQEPSNG